MDELIHRLETLVTTDLNLLLDVGFNREVGVAGVVHFTKNDSNLMNIINNLHMISCENKIELGLKAKKRI